MAKISCKQKMPEVLEALKKWEASHDLTSISIDYGPECEEDWCASHAIIYFSMEGLEEFADVDRARDSAIEAVQAVLGKSFQRAYKDTKLVPGKLYFQVHGSGELEIYREKR